MIYERLKKLNLIFTLLHKIIFFSIGKLPQWKCFKLSNIRDFFN